MKPIHALLLAMINTIVLVWILSARINLLNNRVDKLLSTPIELDITVGTNWMIRSNTIVPMNPALEKFGYKYQLL